MIGAYAVSGNSPVHKDRLVEIAINCYKTDENISKTATCLYNSDKEILDFTMI